MNSPTNNKGGRSCNTSESMCARRPHIGVELAIMIKGVASPAHTERGSAHMLRQTLSRWQTDLGVDGMSNGLTLDGLSSMTELPTMVHEVVCQGRHILSLEDVPHSASPTIPVIAASAPSLNSFIRAAGPCPGPYRPKQLSPTCM